MIAFILSKLFPPRLPGPISDWDARVDYCFNEQGWAGNVKRGPYRDGIERYFAERTVEKRQTYTLSVHQYLTQLRAAEMSAAADEHLLRTQGYVNTIHDCWERLEE